MPRIYIVNVMRSRCRTELNILDYINELIEQGYSEENAEICADCLFSEFIETEVDIYEGI